MPAIVLLLLAEFGIGDRRWLIAFVVADVVLVLAGFALHHDMAVRKLLALVGGDRVSRSPGSPRSRGRFARRARRRGRGAARRRARPRDRHAVTLGGALVVVGLLYTPLTMTEIDRFAGVKTCWRCRR